MTDLSIEESKVSIDNLQKDLINIGINPKKEESKTVEIKLKKIKLEEKELVVKTHDKDNEDGPKSLGSVIWESTF